MQLFSDPTRETDPHALPDVEVFYDGHEHCGDRDPDGLAACGGEGECTHLEGWYWWSCFPGCLPDSKPNGPFDTQQDAINDAQEVN